jgi:hypothetical protein
MGAGPDRVQFATYPQSPFRAGPLLRPNGPQRTGPGQQPNPRSMRLAPKHARWMPFILANLGIPALDFSQSAASGVQIIEAIARQAYLICRKAIESLQPYPHIGTQGYL